MTSNVSSDERFQPFVTEAERRHASLQEAESALVAFQRRHADDRDLARAHAMVELAIQEIRRKRSG